jgi:hypothetical protein
VEIQFRTVFGMVEEQKSKILCHKQDHLAYRIDDVDVPRQACCSFRNIFSKLDKMDPFR